MIVGGRCLVAYCGWSSKLYITTTHYLNKPLHFVTFPEHLLPQQLPFPSILCI